MPIPKLIIPRVKSEEEAVVILHELQDNEKALSRLREKAHWHHIPLQATIEQYGDPRDWDKIPTS